MKVSYKVALLASLVMTLSFSCLSWFQYIHTSNTLYEQTQNSVSESTQELGNQITNWLNGKLNLINMMAENIDAEFSQERIQQVFDAPILKKEFLLMFGGLDTDGKRITNDPSWNPKNWDARKRPWYPYAKSNSQAVLTDPYADAATKEILISAVANFYDKGEFKGAFGGDLSLKTISEAVNNLNFNNSGYAFLLSSNGNIISHPNEGLNGKPLSELFQNEVPSLTPEITEIESANGTLMTLFYKLDGIKGSDWLIGIVLEKDKVMSKAQELGLITLVSTIIAALLISLILYFVISNQLKPLQSLKTSLQEMNRGEGDLTRRLNIKSNDEFGRLANDFNNFIEYLQALIRNAKNISTEIEKNSELTTESAASSASRLQSQLSELDQLATAMEEMSSTAQNVAGNAQVAADSANKAGSETEQGVQVVSKTVESISSLVLKMDKIVDTVKNLSTYSNDIASVLTVINEIAEQTNLLALNAAIEAARAGEMGRGFAVVADEVRALASRTQQSTGEVNSMIEQLKTGVKEAENVIIDSRQKANDTQEIAGKADQTLERIHGHISEINQMNIQIAASAEEQSATTAEINRNTSNIRDLSHAVAENAKQQEKNSEEMLKLTRKQEAEMNKLKV